MAAERQSESAGAGDADLGGADWRARAERAEGELALLRRLLDLLPDFYYVHNWELRFQLVNRASAALWDTTPEHLIGRTYAEVDGDAEQSQRIVDVCRAVMASGVPQRVDGFVFRHPDGRQRTLTQFNVPFAHPQTGEPMLLGIARDMTTEAELLEERVRREALERDLRVAQGIQRSILPSAPPRTPGFEVAAAMEPSQYASGDFYDWWAAKAEAEGTGPTVLCLGDVTGHGIGPAIIAAECRAYARALFGGGGGGLHGDVQRLSAAMSEDLGEGRFVTLAAVTLEGDGAHVVSAGHGPVLVLRTDGRVEEVASHGLPLGIAPELAYEEATRVRLAEGEVLVVLSDGIPEAKDRGGRMLGVRAVAETLRGCATASAAGMAGVLLELARSHAGRTQPEDDMTALVMRRGAGSAVGHGPAEGADRRA
jgi:PAS domain S-box-containing protein